MKKLRFDELPLSKAVLKAVADMGFEEASPIQSETIPLLMQGRDIIGQAQTGTGKTAAFAIPLIEKIKPGTGLQAIVLCPTRELVIQVSEEFRKLIKYMERIAIVPVYGGQEIDRQLTALRRNPEIVVGTPGRTMDHIRRRSIKMDSVRMVVLDEADEMLDMGFREDMEIILKDTPADRQTILFSATMSSDILRLTKNYQKDPVRIDVTAHKINAPRIEQVYFEIPDKSKPEALARLIDYHAIKLALVFCNTKNQVDSLVEILKSRGYYAEALHGDLNQKQRDKVMNGFRNGTVEILVATDVAGRGIDVNDVGAVFNYDLPRDDEDYIHRIGRTGRAGKSGKAFTFVSGRLIYSIKRIEKTNGITIVRKQIPTISDLDSTRIKDLETKIKSTVEKGSLAKYVNMVENLISDDHTSMDIAAALIKMTMETAKSSGYDDSQKFDAETSSRQSSGRPYDRKKPRFQDGKKPYGKSSSSSGSGRSYGKSASSGERKPYGKSSSSGERKPYGKPSSSGDVKSYGSTKRSKPGNTEK